MYLSKGICIEILNERIQHREDALGDKGNEA